MRRASNGIRSPAPTIRTATTKAARVTGRALVARRLRLWSKDPHCASCGRLVDYPHGFELDHILPLHLGGTDHDSNCQILCVYTDDLGRKAGCHADKTAAEAKAVGTL
jgi:5-methylcytosine-specific restriction endonuclease McrA